MTRHRHAVGAHRDVWYVPRVEARTKLPPDPRSPGAARRFVISTLSSWSLESAADTVVLLVSELVTNALLHARSEIELALTNAAGELRVEVIDASPILPHVQPYRPAAGTGRGLVLVEALSTDWGAHEDGNGKVVWFTMPARERPMPAAQSAEPDDDGSPEPFRGQSG